MDERIDLEIILLCCGSIEVVFAIDLHLQVGACFIGYFASERLAYDLDDALIVGVSHEAEVPEIHAKDGDTARADLVGGAQDRAIAP